MIAEMELLTARGGGGRGLARRRYGLKLISDARADVAVERVFAGLT